MKFIDLSIPTNCKEIAMQIDSYREIYNDIVLEPIFEPVQIREIIKNKMELKITTGLDIIAWQKELSYGCIVKMKKIEEAILNSLSFNDIYSTSILLRHHMELSGLLALALEVLIKSIEENDIDILQKFMAKTWFGSSFYNNPKLRDGELAFGNIETPTVSAMIKALDNFLNDNAQEKANTFAHNYAWFCQIAHPSSISSCFFSNSEKMEHGHTINMSWEPDYALHQGAFMMLNMLKQNLMVGLANYFIFSSYQFHDNFSYTQDENKVKYAFYKILNRFSDSVE